MFARASRNQICHRDQILEYSLAFFKEPATDCCHNANSVIQVKDESLISDKRNAPTRSNGVNLPLSVTVSIAGKIGMDIIISATALVMYC